MEEETEQLDYDDEDELEVARKKAKELRKELELMARKQASAQHSTVASELPTTQSTSSVVTTSTTINSSSNAPFLQLQQQQSMPRPGRYYVNPNFNVNRHKSFSHHPHMNSLPTSMTRPPRFTQPMTYYPNQQQIYTHQPRHILQAFPPHQMQAQQHFSHPHQQFIYRPGAPPVPPVPALPANSGSNNIYINRSAMSSRNNWDLMVDEFVRKNISSARRRRHSRSRSSSRSSTSGYSRPRSRSKSRSSSSSRRRNSSRKRAHPPTANVRKNGSNQQVKITHQTMECARAIGLDEEYLKKVEEQSRLREEIARRKSQHRKKENSKAEGKSEAALPAAGDGQASARKRPKIQGPLAQAAAAAEDGKRRRGESPGKLRPYLAVVVTNLRGVAKAQQKIAQLGAAVGPVKKIWRVGPDDCHVIFEKHEHAKQFMLEHHGKQVDKACIDVTLKKVFLNLTGAGGITTE